jgi:chromosome segregation ATPase
MEQASIIQTGVDRLVQLIKQSNRISVPDAAKTLNVSKVVVEEWADFLEEEGIISIEYKFTTPYLVNRVMNKKQVTEKINEFKGKQEGFVRKAEVALCMLDKNSEVFAQMKEDFNKLKQDLRHDVEAVREELLLLDKYNEEKLHIDRDIKAQERSFTQKIEAMEAQVLKERRRYGEIFKEVSSEQVMLSKEKLRAYTMKRLVQTLEKTVQRFETTVAKVKQGLEVEEHSIENSEQHIRRLRHLADATKREVTQNQRYMQTLMAKSSVQQKKIMQLQATILRKAARKQKVLRKGEKAPTNKFKKYFEHNRKIEDYLNKIEHDKLHLQHELDDLIRKAKAFNLVAQKQDVSAYVGQLNKKFQKLERDKSKFETEVRGLRRLVKV